MNRALQCLLAVAALIFSGPARAVEKPDPDPPPRVVVVGNVRAPGAYPFKTGMKIMEVLSVTGTNEFAGAIVYLIRNGESTKILPKRIRRDPEKDVPLKPWDIIYVP